MQNSINAQKMLRIKSFSAEENSSSVRILCFWFHAYNFWNIAYYGES